MGAYLTKANTEIHTTDGENVSGTFKYAHSSMQGWRLNMEDAYCCSPNLLENLGLYAVFDGHGGPEVAEYVSQILPEAVQEKLSENIKKLTDLDQQRLENKESLLKPSAEYLQVLGQLLQTVLIEIDASITQETVAKKLKELADKDDKGSSQQINSEDEAEEREEELKDLMMDNELSIEELMEKYGYEKGYLSKGQDEEASRSSSKSTSKNESQAQTSNSQKLTTAFDGINDDDDEDEEENTELETKDFEEEVSEDEEDETVEKEDVIDEDDESETLEAISKEELEDLKAEAEEAEAKELEENKENIPEAEKRPLDKIRKINFVKSKIAAYLSEDQDMDDTDNKSEDLLEGKEDEDSDGPKSKYPRLCFMDDLPDPENIYQNKQSRGVESGTTAVVSLISESGLMVCANVGDSRCLVGRILNKENENNDEADVVDSNKYIAIDMSIDHKPEDEIEHARIKKAGGIISRDGRVDGGLNLSRCVGDHLYKQTFDLPLTEQKISSLPDLRYIQLTNLDKFVVLACDGIWNSMSSQEVAEFVGSRLDAGETTIQITEAILNKCVAPDTKGDGTGCDNMTIVIIRIDPKFATKFSKTVDLSQPENLEASKIVHFTEKHLVQEDADKQDQKDEYFDEKFDTFTNLNFLKMKFNCNKSDGSSQYVGKKIELKETSDFKFNSTSNLWEQRLSCQIKSDEPPTKKQKQ